jgi:hypothetical protein
MFLMFYIFVLPYTLVVTYMYFSVLYGVHLRMAHVGRNTLSIFGCYRGKVFIFFISDV